MKILIVTPRLPYPPIEGMRIKSYHLIKQLHERGHKMILISALLDPPDVDPNNIQHIQRYVESLKLIDYTSISPKLLDNILESFYIPTRELVARLKLHHSASYIVKLIREEQPNIIYYDFIHSLTLIGAPKDDLSFKNIPSILSLCDSYSLVLRERIKRGIDITPNSFVRWVYALASFPFAVNLEKKLQEMFRVVQVVSKSDAEWLKSLNPSVNVVTIPNGVDVDYFKPMKEVAEESGALVMLANFRVDEHVNNAIWFLTKIFKKLKKVKPNVKLYLVGKDPPTRLVRLARSIGNVIVTGYVPDIRPYLMRASLVVDARRERFGMLNHILQAMSMGKCVIGTPCSFLAINGMKPWRDAVIARDEDDFMLKLTTLLDDETTRREIGSNARKFIESNYTWERVVVKYEEMYHQAIREHTSGEK